MKTCPICHDQPAVEIVRLPAGRVFRCCEDCWQDIREAALKSTGMTVLEPADDYALASDLKLEPTP